MTESTNSPATTESSVTTEPTATTGSAATTPPPNSNSEQKSTSCGNRSGLLLSLIAIALSLAVTAGWYYQSRQNVQRAADTQERQSRLERQQSEQAAEIRRLSDNLSRQNQQWDETNALLRNQSAELAEVQNKIADLGRQNSKEWLLAEADFMVKLAGRKLWSDQDILSATALLKSADNSLAEMNDPSLLEVRRLLAQDIATLTSLQPLDLDGIILQLNQLANQVDNLTLYQQKSLTDAPEPQTPPAASGRLEQWQQNLKHSWQQFLAAFITIRQREESSEPWQRPEQALYLKENIRVRLLIAAQAVPRHQEAIYQQSLATVASWVKAYFSPHDSATQAFLQQIDELSQRPIDLKLPAQLQSQALLDKLTRTRVRDLLAQPSAIDHQEG